MQKQVCLITGATDGVGKFTALALGRQGFTVVFAARERARAESLQAEMARVTGRTDTGFILCDLRSLAQVRRLAEEFKQRYGQLDALINNAGIFVGSRTLTKDGFESMYQVNYLSHFLLTNLLVDELKRSPDGRIINLTSNIYTMGKFAGDNLQGERHFSAMGAYAASKLFMVMFTRELARRLEGTRVTAHAVHPGIVRTQMMMRAPGLLKIVTFLALPFSVPPEKGAATSVFLATHPEVKGASGGYYVNSQRKKIKTRFDSDADRALLWETSMAQLQNGPGFLSAPA